MSRILAVIRRDFDHVRGNVIALLVCMGLVIMPSLYAWFNIAGGWDPYANTGGLKVAVANSDEGVQGSILPFRINVGERVVSNLAGSEKIGYVITSEDDAIDGVYSGEYYAAVVIPADFSTNLLSVFSKSPNHPQLLYYVNEKRNPIASIVTGKASTSIQTMINEDLSATVSQTTTDIMDELGGVLVDDSLLSVASRLNSVVEDSLGALRSSATNITAYQGVITSIRNVTATSDAMLGNDSLSLDAAGKLSGAADKVRDFDAKIQNAKQSASGAIDSGLGALSEVETSINDAFNTASGETDKLVEALNKADAAAIAHRNNIQALCDALSQLNGDVSNFAAQVQVATPDETVTLEGANRLSVDVSDALSRAESIRDYLNELIGTLEKGIGDITAAQGNAEVSRAELAALVADARANIDAVRNSYNDSMGGSLGSVANAIDSAADEAQNVSSTLKTQIDTLTPLLSGTSTDLQGLEDTLGKAAKKLNDSADKLDALHTKLEGALSSGDLDLVRTIFAGDPNALVDFFSAPVALERTAVYAVENNGSAMAPYYTTMALWVGGTLMGILIFTGISAAAMEETRAKPRHAYLGRLAFFVVLGALQSTILLLGDLFFLKIQCAHPLQFMLTGWLASFVFINIVFALSATFGDVGKAIGVLFMVVQVAGSGGTFPVEMLPKLFQTLYRFLPFVYSETAFRETICGMYGNVWLHSMGVLALYLVPALLLGLVLRKPFVPINEWIEEHLEETKFM